MIRIIVKNYDFYGTISFLFCFLKRIDIKKKIEYKRQFFEKYCEALKFLSEFPRS